MPRLLECLPGYAMLFCLLFGTSAPSQSLQQNAPAHLSAGLNRGTLDSGGGSHYWDLTLNAGSFRLVVANDSPMKPFPPGHQPKVSISLLPNSEGATITQRTIPGGGTVFQGSVAQRTRVLIVVEPVKSAVPESLDYTLVATGSVDFGGS